MIETNSFWKSHDGQTFVVKHVVDVNNHTWVHYGRVGTDQEYSCWIESFQERFVPYNNQNKNV